MQIHLHQTHHGIADFAVAMDYLTESLHSAKPGLHLFPEGYLGGYPLQDLCLEGAFIAAYQHSLQEITHLSCQLPPAKDILFLLGGLQYQLDQRERPIKIFNSLYTLSPGQALKAIYQKQLLPGNDIFDESKYFSPGNKNKVINFSGKNIGLLICEDMWPSLFYQRDPVAEWAQEKQPLDLVINLSASPFYLTKSELRIQRICEVSHLLKTSVAYVNQVGGDGEVLFSGQSLVVNGDDILAMAPAFKSAYLSVELPAARDKYRHCKPSPLRSIWQNSEPESPSQGETIKLIPLSPQELDRAACALQFGLQEYATKNGLTKFLVAVSGGIDSALVLTLAKLALRHGQSLEALSMPGRYSSPQSHELADKLCRSLGVPCKALPIKFFHAACRNGFADSLASPLEGLADENIQSRLRSTLLYARANQTNAMVLNTSNKSELAVGYCTQYGDSVGAISLLGDLYKSEVYQLAEYVNQGYGELIPREIIQRPPTAELREGQRDSDCLPEYPVLDAILEGLVNYRMSPRELVRRHHCPQIVAKVARLHISSEFKRAQFCPIIKIKPKSYGFGHRIPLAKNIDYYMAKTKEMSNGKG